MISDYKNAFYNLILPLALSVYTEYNVQNIELKIGKSWENILEQYYQNGFSHFTTPCYFYPELSNAEQYVLNFFENVSQIYSENIQPLSYNKRFNWFLHSFAAEIQKSMQNFHLYTKLENATFLAEQIMNLHFEEIQNEQYKETPYENTYIVKTTSGKRNEEQSALDELANINTSSNLKQETYFSKYLPSNNLFNHSQIAQFTDIDQLILTEISVIHESGVKFCICKICGNLFTPSSSANKHCRYCQKVYSNLPQKKYYNSQKNDPIKYQIKKLKIGSHNSMHKIKIRQHRDLPFYVLSCFCY